MKSLLLLLVWTAILYGVSRFAVRHALRDHYLWKITMKRNNEDEQRETA